MKILLLDIETSPNIVYSWGLWDQNIAINQIIKPSEMICWAAKWYGQKKIQFDSIHVSTRRQMVKRIYKLVNEADAIIHYNGTSFDMPILNQEFLFLGLDPPSSYTNIDLLRTARSQFRFPSNKLEYVSSQLGIGQKVKHMGMELWRGCLNGDSKSWALMKRYNRQDVVLLERAYKILLPWIKRHPNWGIFIDSDKKVCRNCGSKSVRKNGIRYNATLAYQRWVCNDCGAGMRSRTRIKTARDGVLV